MEGGRIVQVGTPAEIYEHPRSRFVSDFIGVSNFLPGRVVGVEGARLVVELPGPLRVRAAAGDAFAPGDAVEIAVRPEKIRLAVEPGPADNRVPGRIESLVYLGAVTYYYLRLPGELRLVVLEQNLARRPARAPGEAVDAVWDASSALALRRA
jgi:ABC-type Fe3+/spermidine/putrescine transport system ATPase subunit